MTCYVTYDGTIKLDNHVVGQVHELTCFAPGCWAWWARVNGRSVAFYSGGSDRETARNCAREFCEEEAMVIR